MKVEGLTIKAVKEDINKELMDVNRTSYESYVFRMLLKTINLLIQIGELKEEGIVSYHEG